MKRDSVANRWFLIRSNNSVWLWLTLGLLYFGIQSTVRGEEGVQVIPKQVELIEPGTVIGDSAPEGWTLLLTKNSSTIGAGDLDAANDSLKHLASFLSSVMVVRLETVTNNDGTRLYVLKDVGYGLCTQVDQKDMVISSQTYKQLGAGLGFLDSLALSKAEARLKNLQIVAQTRSMAIVDSPTLVLIEGKHQDVLLRHAILTGPTTGTAITLVWFIQPLNGPTAQVVSDIDYFPPNSEVDIVLHLDRSLFTLGVVTERALARNKMMWGKAQLKMPTEVRPLARLERFTEEEVVELEGLLRGAVQQASSRP